MRTRSLTVVAAALAALLGVPAAALDAPHDGSFTEGICQACHKLHASSGTLVNQPDNNTTCTACHNKKVGSLRGFPWLSDRQASPGVGGDQHSWTGYADNPGIGAQAPATHSEMLVRLSAGQLQCSTCHDQHAANKHFAPRSLHTSIAIGAAKGEDGNALGGRGNGTLTLASVGADAGALGTRVRIRTAIPGVGGTFILSHDFGMTTPTWFNWNGVGWIAGTATGDGKPYDINTPVTLDDPTVSVSIGDGVFVGDYWDFSIAFPFLRASNENDAMCQDCHRDRVMNHACVEGVSPCVADGARKFSHPVNQGLNANGKNYDRTPANPDASARVLLDADGTEQTVGDGVATNDLRMNVGPDLTAGTADDQVGCTTCHAVHNADSNSLTEDPR